MKHTSIAAVALAAVSCVMGQQNKALPAPANAEKVKLTDLVRGLVTNHGTPEELKQLDDVCTTATVQSNVEALKLIEADDFTFTGPDGTIVSKQEDLRSLESGDLIYESISLDDVSARVFNDSGVVTGRANVKGHFKSFDISGPYRYTIMFVKRGGRWQAVASQMTRIRG